MFYRVFLIIALISIFTCNVLHSQQISQNLQYEVLRTIMSEHSLYPDFFKMTNNRVSSQTIMDCSDSLEIVRDVKNLYYRSNVIDSVYSYSYTHNCGSGYTLFCNSNGISQIDRYYISSSGTRLSGSYFVDYDSLGHITEFNYSPEDSTNYSSYHKYFFFYENDRISEVRLEKRDISTTYFSERFFIHYNIDNILIIKQENRNGDWWNDERDTISHNGNIMIGGLHQYYSDSDSTLFNNSSKWIYNLENDHVSSGTYYLWRNGVWKEFVRHIRSYDVHNRLTDLVIQGREDSVWVNHVRTVYTYLPYEAKAAENIPKHNLLLTNYPNPFNPETNIQYSLSNTGAVRLDIYNIKGQKVKTLIDGQISSGNHSIVWNGKSDSGIEVSSGVYFLRLAAGKQLETRKIVLMK